MRTTKSILIPILNPGDPIIVESAERQRLEIRLAFFGTLNSLVECRLGVSDTPITVSSQGICILWRRTFSSFGNTDTEAISYTPLILTRLEHGDIVGRAWFAAQEGFNNVPIISVLETFDLIIKPHLPRR